LISGDQVCALSGTALKHNNAKTSIAGHFFSFLFFVNLFIFFIKCLLLVDFRPIRIVTIKVFPRNEDKNLLAKKLGAKIGFFPLQKAMD
jgi:hypothetical protein